MNNDKPDAPSSGRIGSPPKAWWPGDPRVEPYMQPVADAISRHVRRGDGWTDIYNRAYEAVCSALQANAQHHSEATEGRR